MWRNEYKCIAKLLEGVGEDFACYKLVTHDLSISFSWDNDTSIKGFPLWCMLSSYQTTVQLSTLPTSLLRLSTFVRVRWCPCQFLYFESPTPLLRAGGMVAILVKPPCLHASTLNHKHCVVGILSNMRLIYWLVLLHMLSQLHYSSYFC